MAAEQGNSLERPVLFHTNLLPKASNATFRGEIEEMHEWVTVRQIFPEWHIPIGKGSLNHQY